MTESHSPYNGWSNYETWLVNLWLNNEEEAYNLCRSLAKSSFEDTVADQSFSRENKSSNILANKVKEIVENRNPLLNEASIYSDLLNASIGKVNWREIANAFAKEIDQA